MLLMLENSMIFYSKMTNFAVINFASKMTIQSILSGRKKIINVMEIYHVLNQNLTTPGSIFPLSCLYLGFMCNLELLSSFTH